MVGGISFCVIKTEIVLCFAKEYFTCGSDGDDHDGRGKGEAGGGDGDGDGDGDDGDGWGEDDHGGGK